MKKHLGCGKRGAFAMVVAATLMGCGASAADSMSDEALAGEQREAWATGNWSATSNMVAAGAFTTGDATLYLPVCRASYDNGLHPGKFWENQCLFEWGWQKHAASNFQTLVNPGSYRWYHITSQVCGANGCIPQVLPIPQNAIDGGPAGTQGGNVTLGVCKVLKGGEYHPGKFYANKCNIEWGGSGYALNPAYNDTYIAVSN